MTGLELCNSAAYELRDYAPVPHNLYPLSMKLALLKKGLRMLASELAAKRSNLVEKSVSLVCAAGSGLAELPADHMAAYVVYLPGSESLGGLKLVSGPDRYKDHGTPGAYYIDIDGFRLAPATETEATRTLVYGAWPAFVLQAEPELNSPDLEATAQAQLANELPFNGIFDEALKQFLIMACANSEEYDTKTEQGLYAIIKNAADDLGGRDSISGFSTAGPGGLWAGSC